MALASFGWLDSGERRRRRTPGRIEEEAHSVSQRLHDAAVIGHVSNKMGKLGELLVGRKYPWGVGF